MTISDDTIKNAVLRYHREYDRYSKLSARVAEICRFEIVEGNAIRAQVTFRAKSPKSLEGKLRRFAASGKKDLTNVQSVFDAVRDLAAVRIATYEQRHEDQVIQLVCKRFIDLKGATPAGERKDKNAADNNNFYRATHIEAFLPGGDVIGTYANVADVPCEAQGLKSMMSYVREMKSNTTLATKLPTGSDLGTRAQSSRITSASPSVRALRLETCSRRPSGVRQREHGGVLTMTSTTLLCGSGGGFRISTWTKCRLSYTKPCSRCVLSPLKASGRLSSACPSL